MTSTPEPTSAVAKRVAQQLAALTPTSVSPTPKDTEAERWEAVARQIEGLMQFSRPFDGNRYVRTDQVAALVRAAAVLAASPAVTEGERATTFLAVTQQRMIERFDYLTAAANDRSGEHEGLRAPCDALMAQWATPDHDAVRITNADPRTVVQAVLRAALGVVDRVPASPAVTAAEDETEGYWQVRALAAEDLAKRANDRFAKARNANDNWRARYYALAADGLMHAWVEPVSRTRARLRCNLCDAVLATFDACDLAYAGTTYQRHACPAAPAVTAVPAEPEWGREAPHTLTAYGTTNCPVEGVRAEFIDGECSACGALGPLPSPARQRPSDLRDRLDRYLTARGIAMPEDRSTEHLRSEVDELDASLDARPWIAEATRHEIADVILAAVTIASSFGWAVEDCIEAKTEYDQGRGAKP